MRFDVENYFIYEQELTKYLDHKHIEFNGLSFIKQQSTDFIESYKKLVGLERTIEFLKIENEKRNTIH